MEPIGPLQLKVMHHVWAHGPSTVREVHDALMADPQAKRLAYTTILAVMRNLARRGFLAQRRQRQGGLAHRFSPRVAQTSYEQAAIRHMRCEMFRGDLRAMLAAVAADTELSPADRRRIRGAITAAG
jgi:predicted transcriptional regulator